MDVLSLLIPQNRLAFCMIVGGYPTGVALAYLAGCPNPAIVGFVFAGPILVLLDLVYRRKVGKRCWFDPERGGHFLFMPVWLLGGIYVIFGLLMWDIPPYRPAPRNPGAPGVSNRIEPQETPSVREANGRLRESE